MKKLPEIIVITGAESTGKTALTEWLARHFEVSFIPELARSYVEQLDRDYTYHDVEIIAKRQKEQLDILKKSTSPVVFADTWLIITKIWFEEVFKKYPSWIDTEISKTRIDMFLVCDTDLPWVPDPVRENGGEQREILQQKYIDTIEKFHFNYHIISGEGEDRFRNALKHLRHLNTKN